MTILNEITPTPWDREVFGIDTYELKSVTREVLERISTIRGHFTVKVHPLASKQLLHEFGFYYCDTLVEPFCSPERLVIFENEAVSISQEVALEALIAICHGAFAHGRFHRDFHIDRELADRRYDRWLAQLYKDRNVYGLTFEKELAGFIAIVGNRLVLHALDGRFRGKGLAKFLWSAACREFFQFGYSELTSSVSASNMAVLNLYVSLGFRFRTPMDVYHRMAL